MKATELHARLGGTLHTLSAASWALHVSRWRPSTPARFDAEWELHPAERREVVVFNRRCYENRYSRAFGDVAYAYAGQVAQASPIEATAPCGELLAACNGTRRLPERGVRVPRAVPGVAGLTVCLMDCRVLVPVRVCVGPPLGN